MQLVAADQSTSLLRRISFFSEWRRWWWWWRPRRSTPFDRRRRLVRGPVLRTHGRSHRRAAGACDPSSAERLPLVNEAGFADGDPIAISQGSAGDGGIVHENSAACRNHRVRIFFLND